jgi:hypothetical protein
MEGLMREQKPILELYRDDTLLAVLSNIQLCDWPWYSCNFQPTPAFEEYRPLFDQELKLLEGEGATQEWDMAYEKIENLHLTLSYPSQAKATDIFLLHIDGETARFKAVFD